MRFCRRFPAYANDFIPKHVSTNSLNWQQICPVTISMCRRPYWHRISWSNIIYQIYWTTRRPAIDVLYNYDSYVFITLMSKQSYDRTTNELSRNWWTNWKTHRQNTSIWPSIQSWEVKFANEMRQNPLCFNNYGQFRLWHFLMTRTACSLCRSHLLFLSVFPSLHAIQTSFEIFSRWSLSIWICVNLLINVAYTETQFSIHLSFQLHITHRIYENINWSSVECVTTKCIYLFLSILFFFSHHRKSMVWIFRKFTKYK